MHEYGIDYRTIALTWTVGALVLFLERIRERRRPRTDGTKETDWDAEVAKARAAGNVKSIRGKS